MQHDWLRVRRFGGTCLLVASLVAGCSDDDSGPSPESTPSHTAAPSPTQVLLPSSTPVASATATLTPTEILPASFTPTADSTATPSSTEIPPPPGGFKVASGAARRGVAVGRGRRSWLIAYESPPAEERVGVLYGVRVGGNDVVLDSEPIDLGAPLTIQQGELDDEFGETRGFSWPRITFDGSAYAVAYFAWSTYDYGESSAPSMAHSTMWGQRIDESGALRGGPLLLLQVNLRGELPLRENRYWVHTAPDVDQMMGLIVHRSCSRIIITHLVCYLKSISTSRIQFADDRVEHIDMADLFRTSMPISGTVTDLSSDIAAASSGAATLAVWGMSTRRSLTDGGGAPELAGAIVADGESKLVNFVVSDGPVTAVSVAAYRSDFLVVWRTSSRGALFGMFVDAEGDVVGPLPDRQPFPIAAETTGTIVLQGTAATEHGLLVLWSEADYLYATRIDASGNVGESLLIDPYSIVHSGALAASRSGYLITYLRPTGEELADVMARYVPELRH